MTTQEASEATGAELPGLLLRLAEQAMQLIDERMQLAEAEWRAHLARMKLLAFGFGVALGAAFIGLQLLTIGLVLGLGTWVQPTWLALLLGGVVWLAGGLFFVHRLGRELRTPRRIFARTGEELARDREWLSGKI